MSSISSDCQNAELLAHSLPYRVIIVFKGSVNATTLFLFFLFYIFKGRTTIFHPNTKIIYHFICTFLFLISLHTTVVYAYEIYRLSSLINNSCDRLWWTPFFFYLRNANGDFLNGVNSSLIVMCVERAFCILHISSYEQSSKPTLVAVFLLVLLFIFSIIFFLLSLYGVDLSRGLPIATLRNEKNGFSFQIRLVFSFFTELLGVIFFLSIHLWCLQFEKKIRGFALLGQRSNNVCNVSLAHLTLTVKFQVEETLKLTALFLPIVITKCSMQILSSTFAYFANKLWPNPTTDVQMIIYELVNISYIQTFPIILLLLHGSGRINLSCYGRSSQNSVVQLNADNQSDYFQRLNKMFDNVHIQV